MPATALRLVALFAALSWLGGTVAQFAHAAIVQHVVCEEHGDVVELADADAHIGDRVELSAPDRGDHGHGCDFEHVTFTVASLDVPPALVPPVPLAPPEDPLVRATPPRGPPLAYAPKTSPPLA